MSVKLLTLTSNRVNSVIIKTARYFERIFFCISIEIYIIWYDGRILHMPLVVFYHQ